MFKALLTFQVHPLKASVRRENSVQALYIPTIAVEETRDVERHEALTLAGESSSHRPSGLDPRFGSSTAGVFNIQRAESRSSWKIRGWRQWRCYDSGESQSRSRRSRDCNVRAKLTTGEKSYLESVSLSSLNGACVCPAAFTLVVGTAKVPRRLKGGNSISVIAGAAVLD